ncbi:MAG: asparaginase domain-containing protein [bacterium]
MTLRIIATGGTFDKHYNELTGQLVLGKSVLPTVLERARFTQTFVFEHLFALDSLDMQEQHRQQIRKACDDSAEDSIVIVHGTDTMCDTADVLGNAGLLKTIVLTGAMIPYEVLNSDALFNLGFAMAAAQLCPAGVFVAMNGQIFPWNDVKKNRDTGVFERR